MKVSDPECYCGFLKLSLVIPTYNRDCLLPITIPALASLRTAEGITYEVIFVDDASSDTTPTLLNEAVLRYPDRFRYIRIAHSGGPGAPRNTGLRAATGDVIVMIDDDVVPDSDLLLQYAEFHTRYPEQNHAAVGEAYIPERLRDDPMSWFHSFPFDKWTNTDNLDYMHFWTCNVSVKREFMLTAGMFDETFLLQDDVYCGYRLWKNGMQLHLWVGARGEHLYQFKPEGIPAKGVRLGRWHYRFLEEIGWERIALINMRVLSYDLPKFILLKRILGRAAFRILDNPLTMWTLEKLGARTSRRNRITDTYYAFIYHRNILKGYYEAKRSADAGAPLDLFQLELQMAKRRKP
jgi:glycosyltransferase involved in cell wall biosynthesis